MSKNLCKKVGEVGQDNLIAHAHPPALPFGVKIAAGEGDLPRGTVLVLDDSGTYKVLGTDTTGKANCILADPVDASGEEPVTGVAYRTGHFNIKALVVEDNYVLTAADKEELRKGGILLSETLD